MKELTELEQQIYILSKEGITTNELIKKLNVSNKEIADAVLTLIGKKLLDTKQQAGKPLIFIQYK